MNIHTHTMRAKVVADCPACILNINYIRAITKEGVTQEEQDEATRIYQIEGNKLRTAYRIKNCK